MTPSFPRGARAFSARDADASPPRSRATQLGYRVAMASHGREGVQSYLQNADELLCVLMDLQARCRLDATHPRARR